MNTDKRVSPAFICVYRRPPANSLRDGIRHRKDLGKKSPHLDSVNSSNRPLDSASAQRIMIFSGSDLSSKRLSATSPSRARMVIGFQLRVATGFFVIELGLHYKMERIGCKVDFTR
jgi:hypothetical protein